MVARLKLKGIDGGSHKRWRMWLNSRLREEPYPRLDMVEVAKGVASGWPGDDCDQAGGVAGGTDEAVVSARAGS